MIQCEHLTVVRRGRVLLDDIYLSVAAGELLALVGPNGAGKSTLLRTLCGEMTPSRGSVSLEGRGLHTLPGAVRAQRVHVMPQDPDASASLTARQVVGLGLALSWGHASSAAVRWALDAAGVGRLADAPLGRLSGGERQRVHLARVVAQSRVNDARQVVLLDEPCSAQDPGHLGLVLRVLDDLRRRHAVVVVLHDLYAVSAFATRVALLEGGRLDRVGPPDQVLHCDVLSRVYGTPFHSLSHPQLARPVVVPDVLLEAP